MHLNAVLETFPASVHNEYFFFFFEVFLVKFKCIKCCTTPYRSNTSKNPRVHELLSCSESKPGQQNTSNYFGKSIFGVLWCSSGYHDVPISCTPSCRRLSTNRLRAALWWSDHFALLKLQYSTKFHGNRQVEWACGDGGFSSPVPWWLDLISIIARRFVQYFKKKIFENDYTFWLRIIWSPFFCQNIA